MLTESPTVTIVVPAFNVEAYLEQCVESVLRQTYTNVELILIDDGSTDSTRTIVDQLALTDSRVIPVKQSNRGLSNSRNRGIELANGELLLFLDADDWLPSDAVDQIVTAMIQSDAQVLVSQCVKYFEHSDEWHSCSDEHYWRIANSTANKAVPAKEVPEFLAIYPLAPLKAFRTEYVRQKGLRFIEGLKYEDNPFHVEVFRQNPMVLLFPVTTYVWRLERQGQITSSAHPEQCLLAIRAMLEAAGTVSARDRPFQIIGITRLAVSVAARILDFSQRQQFFQSVNELVEDRFKKQYGTSPIEMDLLESGVHPGDLILVSGLLRQPYRLSLVMETGRSTSKDACMVLLNLRSNLPMSVWLRMIVSVTFGARKISNLIRGFGESKQTPLGCGRFSGT